MQLGDGCELVLMADILLAVPNTNFRKPEVNIGTIMGGGSLQQLMLTGHMRSAQEAAARGMASRIVRGDSTFITREAISPAGRSRERARLWCRSRRPSTPVCLGSWFSLTPGYVMMIRLSAWVCLSRWLIAHEQGLSGGLRAECRSP
jgi:hypothetical protein